MNPYIGTVQWSRVSKGRLGVCNMGLEWGGTYDHQGSYWAVMDDRGATLQKADGKDAKFTTHAEAIQYATEQATIQAVAAHFTLPPESPAARAMKEPTC